jgi:hypothetical protein
LVGKGLGWPKKGGQNFLHPALIGDKTDLIGVNQNVPLYLYYLIIFLDLGQILKTEQAKP